MIIEMRTYEIKPGLRTEFLEIFESRSVPEHQKIGMKILGPFLSVEDAHTFFFMRAFPDLESRDPVKAQFYEGKLWKEELEQKLMPMIEKYDVVVAEAKHGLGECGDFACQALASVQTKNEAHLRLTPAWQPCLSLCSSEGWWA
jgi:hypothetical protein